MTNGRAPASGPHRSRGRTLQRPFHRPVRRVDVAGVLIRREHQGIQEILLVWNSDWRVPNWSLPGGAREEFETLAEAAVREAREETGLEIELTALVDVFEIIRPARRMHDVFFTFTGTVTGGEVCHDGAHDPDHIGVTECRWFPMREAKDLPLLKRILDADWDVDSPCRFGARYEGGSES
jgi:8-oxo-dGTP diphosphatase